VNEYLPCFTWSTTSHAPAAHAGMKVAGSAPFRLLRAEWLYFVRMLHGPCRRAWESGGVSVRTASVADGGDRLPPRTATTLYW